MMKINVATINNQIGGSIPFEFEKSVANMEKLLDDFIIEDGVVVKGMAVNTGTCFRLEGEITCTIAGKCDRCLVDFKTLGVYSFMEEYTRDKQIAQEEDMNYFDGDFIDVENIVFDTIISAQPTKHLCSLSCKGLCPKCGCDLNKRECSCDKTTIDPRLQALQSLLEK